MTETLRLAIEVDASKGTAVVKEFSGTVAQAKAEWSKAPAAAQGPLAQFNSQMQELQRNWQGVAVGAGIVAGGIYVAARAIGAFADAAAEAEQIESRMVFQLNQVGYNFNEIKPLVDDFADSILKTTRFSDEMARQGLGQMMQYTVDVNQGMEGVRLAMDMSTQTGQDLQSTIRLVGMAMNGNAEILGRWIPELRDLDSKLGATATSAEKAAYAFEILNKKFGGAALADLETYAGRVQRLKNQWDEIQEKIGKGPVMTGLQNWLDWIDLGVEGVNKLGDTYDRIRASWQSLMTGESARNILIRERGEELKRLAKIEQEVAEKAAQLQSAKKEAEELQKRKALRAEQEKIDAEYQTKYLILSGDRVAAIQRERDQILQVAWQKGLSLFSIETYYNKLIIEEEKKKSEEIRAYNLKIRDDAIAIMKDWGIKTEAAAASEVTGILAQFQRIIDNGPFSKEQLEAAKTRVIEKLREIQTAYSESIGHWEEIPVPVGKELTPSGMEYRTVWETEWRWVETGTNKVGQNVEKMIEAAIKELDKLEKATEHPYAVLINTDSITEAERRIAAFEDRLREIVSREWVARVSITGIGSTEKPIMEKIEEVQNAFQTMGSEVGSMLLQMNLSAITKEISELQERLYYNVAPIWASEYMKKGIEWSNQTYRERIAELQNQQKMLTAGAAYIPESSSSGGGGGEVSININTLTVIGGSDLEIAQKLDAALAELIYKDRSKIKQALFS